jgi:hypothetical protein
MEHPTKVNIRIPPKTSNSPIPSSTPVVPQISFHLRTPSQPISINCTPNQSFLYPPTDAQLNCLKNNFKIYIKTDIKTAPTCFGAITIIRERIIGAC